MRQVAIIVIVYRILKQYFFLQKFAKLLFQVEIQEDKLLISALNFDYMAANIRFRHLRHPEAEESMCASTVYGLSIFYSAKENCLSKFYLIQLRQVNRQNGYTERSNKKIIETQNGCLKQIPGPTCKLYLNIQELDCRFSQLGTFNRRNNSLADILEYIYFYFRYSRWIIPGRILYERPSRIHELWCSGLSNCS